MDRPVMTTASRTPVLDALRSATAELHTALEASLRLDQIQADGYAVLLERFFGFYEPLERTAACYAQVGWLDAVNRRKVRWLVSDLRALGRSTEAMARLPRCDCLPPLASAAQQLGCMYVIEGSTLGGTHIARHVLPRLGIDHNRGGAFFNSYGASVGKNWRALLAALESRIITTADRAAAVSGACDTFAALSQWLLSDPKRADHARF
jgi:heme oxygenase